MGNALFTIDPGTGSGSIVGSMPGASAAALAWGPTQIVDIDIKPGNSQNPINPRSNGTESVAILSSAQFDATEIDQKSVKFGKSGGEDSLQTRGGRKAVPNCQIRDSNHDGTDDLVCHFHIAAAGFEAGDTHGILTGETLGGTEFLGIDIIRTVG